MSKARTPDALLVNLIVDDEPGLKESKFARRCAEARQLFRDVFQPKNAGPIATNVASIAVKGEDDVRAVLDFVATPAGKRLIHSVSPLPIATTFVEELKPKKPKSPGDDVVHFGIDLGGEDDDEGEALRARVGVAEDDDED